MKVYHQMHLEFQSLWEYLLKCLYYWLLLQKVDRTYMMKMQQ